MNDLNVSLQTDVCSPDQTLFGNVTWSSVSESAESISIRLIWFTQGKGDRDYLAVDSIDIPVSASSNGAEFEFVLPRRPLSFSGKLISLTWAVEAVVIPSKQSALAEFTLCDRSAKIVLQDKSNELKELGIKTPFFSMGSK